MSRKKKANYKWRSKPFAQIEKGTVNGHTTTGAVTQSVFAQNTSNKNGVRTTVAIHALSNEM